MHCNAGAAQAPRQRAPAHLRLLARLVDAPLRRSAQPARQHGACCGCDGAFTAPAACTAPAAPAAHLRGLHEGDGLAHVLLDEIEPHRRLVGHLCASARVRRMLTCLAAARQPREPSVVRPAAQLGRRGSAHQAHVCGQRAHDWRSAAGDRVKGGHSAQRRAACNSHHSAPQRACSIRSSACTRLCARRRRARLRTQAHRESQPHLPGPLAAPRPRPPAGRRSWLQRARALAGGHGHARGAER